MKHTPAPWFAFLHERGAFEIGTSQDQNAAKILCSRYEWIDISEQMHANARLIAAAPDLLAALREIVRLADANLADINAFVVIDARAAIAKATGATQ